MTRLEESKVLGRKVRKDSPTDLAIPTWDLVSQAIKAGRTNESLDLLDLQRADSQTNNDNLVSLTETVLTYLATNFGEGQVLEAFKGRSKLQVAEFLARNHGIEEILPRGIDSQRRHQANFTVTEEPDRWVVRYDPCGSGGRLRRTRKVGTTKKAYPWSWGKAGVPYYCCHCCISWEIVATELQGYPVRVILVGDRPEDPCSHLYYKKPELIPEEYFTRIGMTKMVK